VGHQLGRLSPLDRSASLLVGRTYLSGTAVSLVGGDPGVPMSHKCKEGEFSFRYLGIPMSPRRLSNRDWRVVEERFQKKKLSSWKGKLLSSGGRLVLINSVLSSLPLFIVVM
jgi:hypothetical protein